MRGRRTEPQRSPRPLRPALLLPLLLLAAAAVTSPAGACTSIIVGGGASSDGSVYIARNDDGEDARSSVNNLLFHHRLAEPAVFRSNENALQVLLPAGAQGYLSMPIILPSPPQGRNASGESAGFNSAGVAVSATESIYNSPAVLAADPYVPSGVSEDAIPSLVLPLARSARHGAQLLGRLVERLGASEGFGVLLADGREAWYLETASGHHWLAQRVPHGSIFVAGNQGRFQGADLSDPSRALSSPGLVDFAIQSGLYDPDSGEPFSFFRAFMADGPRDAGYSYPRVRELQSRLGGRCGCTGRGGSDAGAAPRRALRQQLRADAGGCEDAGAAADGGAGDGMPVFVEPCGPLTVHDVAEGLRLHYKGTPHDPYTLVNPDEPHRPVAVLRSQMGHVTRLRPRHAGLPDALSIIHYVAMGTPLLSPFVPLYKGLPAGVALPELADACTEPDQRSLYWKARRLQALVFQDFPSLAPRATTAIREFEARVESRDRPAMERRYMRALSSGDAHAAQHELLSFTSGVLQRASALLEDLAAQAAGDLGLRGVPADAVLARLLDEAEERYHFLPPV